MLWSKLFIPTLRENLVDTETAHHRLLLRAGYMRQPGAGNFVYLPLGQRSLRRIQQIVREEMDGIGAQEFLLPVLDMRRSEAILGSLARGELRSQKQLPQIWYRIQTRLRDEPRATSAPLHPHQSLGMEAHFFDSDLPGASGSPERLRETFGRIFDRCGLRVETTGSEFLVWSDTGDDVFVKCQACAYFASIDTAVSIASAAPVDDPEGDGPPEEFHTPGRKTIAEVSGFARVPPTAQMKSLVMVTGTDQDAKPLLALVRGDHQLSRAKLAAIVGVREVIPAWSSEIKEWFGADPGSLGPVGIGNIRIVADHALAGRRNMIAGANRNDYHLRNVTPGRDFEAEFFDIRRVSDGDRCSSCGGELVLRKAVTAGSIRKPTAGIGIERILFSLIEQNHDEAGMFLPAAIAPFDVVITPVNNADAALREAAEKIHADCLDGGIDALYDDRDERPGSKFKDADLIGVPCRITLGKKLPQGLVEFTDRSSRTSKDVPVSEVISEIGRFRCRSF